MGSMEMFPDNYQEFIEKYSSKETKFGTEYIPTLKVQQAMAHYIRNQDSESAIEEAIAENPYMILGVCLDVMAAQNRVEIINGIVDQISEKLDAYYKDLKQEIHNSKPLDVIYRSNSFVDPPPIKAIRTDHLGGAYYG